MCVCGGGGGEGGLLDFWNVRVPVLIWCLKSEVNEIIWHLKSQGPMYTYLGPDMSASQKACLQSKNFGWAADYLEFLKKLI